MLIQENKTLVSDKEKLFSLPIMANGETIVLSKEDITPYSKAIFLDNLIELDFQLDTEFIEDRKDIFEIKFYIQKSQNLKILVDGSLANTFQLGDMVELYFFEKKVQIEFSLIEGVGNFWGHIFFSNRPSNDWMIGLRTIRRSLNCRVRAKISFT